MGIFNSASNATLQTSFSQEAYWMLLNDQAMRNHACELVWFSLPYSVQVCLQNCIWGLAERECDRVRSLVMFVSYVEQAEILAVEHYERLQCFRDTLLHLTNVRELRIFGSDVAIDMGLREGQWIEESLALPADWHESKEVL